MFALGFTMEELMFPENYQSNVLFNIEVDCFINKLDQVTSTYENHDQIVIDDDEDDDWFTIKQLNSKISSSDDNFNSLNDQTLLLLTVNSDSYHFGQIKSALEHDDSMASNSSIHIVQEKSVDSSSNDLSTRTSSTAATTMINQQQNKYLMFKSTSSLSFSTQSSTSVTSTSADEMSPQSSHGRRRRKRTIFSAADIEYLKDAFIQNPKPSQQDIAVLSEQLGHDSYVIRVWFYNKRQASKKRII
ncbi:unnamed protein product [Adineta ricciae]|uniref:Homeobox domain-containing protein n=1 Tax=Adineta ricciae TaxID=249248 RepID=A0A815C4N8_ADIRI|nr:unnamed protein product [Adineta ricciae]